jgi:nitrogenase-associated protein
MVTIHFYEKPGCINNAKQKALLIAAGHTLETHNLLTEAWTPERLRSFFDDRPVSDWFNRTAPAVKSGAVEPEALSPEQALALMVDDPILIRRPLIQIGDRRICGFDAQQLENWIGLQAQDVKAQEKVNQLKHQDLQTCPQMQTSRS